MRPDVYWNFNLRVHIMTRERRQELAVHFRTPPPEIDNWLTAPLNGIKHLQSEAKLHSGQEPHAKRP